MADGGWRVADTAAVGADDPDQSSKTSCAKVPALLAAGATDRTGGRLAVAGSGAFAAFRGFGGWGCLTAASGSQSSGQTKSQGFGAFDPLIMPDPILRFSTRHTPGAAGFVPEALYGGCILVLASKLSPALRSECRASKPRSAGVIASPFRQVIPFSRRSMPPHFKMERPRKLPAVGHGHRRITFP